MHSNIHCSAFSTPTSSAGPENDKPPQLKSSALFSWAVATCTSRSFLGVVRIQTDKVCWNSRFQCDCSGRDRKMKSLFVQDMGCFFGINLCWYFQRIGLLPFPFKPGLDPWSLWSWSFMLWLSTQLGSDPHQFLEHLARFCVFIPAPGSGGWKWPGTGTDMEVFGWLVVRTVLSSWCGVRNLFWDCLSEMVFQWLLTSAGPTM